MPSLLERMRARIPLTEKTWSLTTSTLATICLSLVLFLGLQPISGIISPMVSSLQSFKIFAQSAKTYETFSFIPGWADNKFDNIDFNNINTLAFFDLPVNGDGTIDTDNDGYETFTSDSANTLFHTAHAKGSKVVVTLTQTNSSDIKTLLDSSAAQKRLIKQATQAVKDAGIDGVVVDFELKGDSGSSYKNNFTTFIGNLTKDMHQEVPNAQVSVALNRQWLKDSLYDPEALASSADHIFLMAYDFAVSEAKGTTPEAPVYGYNPDSYWTDLNTAINSFAEHMPTEKLVVETAWYGNGDKYPFYQSQAKENPADSAIGNTLTTPLSSDTIDNLVSEVPASARGAARNNLPLIAKALEHEGILTPNVLAYALATIEHETAGTFEPIEEIKGRKSARRLGYEGGTNYFGRGFIQLTHLRNYKKMGERIGMGDELAKNPALAATPDVAAKVLAAFFKDNNIARLAHNGDFVDARRPVNPDMQAGWIAQLAWKYRDMI
jgi:predicted chitinase